MELLQEVRYSFRRLRHSPVATLTAALSLAIGIGGTATIFSLVNALLLRPLPGVEEPSRLVNVYHLDPDGKPRSWSAPNLRDLAEINTVFEGVAGFTDRALSLAVAGEPELVLAQVVTGNYFSLLGVEAAQGRFFDPQLIGAPGSEPVAVISHGLWKRKFGGDPGVVGLPISLNGQPFTIVGVAQEGFGGTFIGFGFDLWAPASMASVLSPRGEIEARENPWLEVVARLEPGVSVTEAQPALETSARQLEQAYPIANAGRTISLRAMDGYDRGLRGGVRAFLAVLMGVAAMVLIIACANVVSMLLAQAGGRSHEVAIRLAMGVSRRLLVRQLLIESLLLALLGGGMGLLLAAWGIRALRRFEPPLALPLVFDVELDLRVLFFTLGVSILAALAFGLTPALKASRPQLVAVLKEARAPGLVRSRMRKLFVIAQVAFSLLLLICTGLFLRSLRHAAETDTGFEAERVTVVSLDPTVLGYDPAAAVELFERLQERFSGLPGVEVVSLSDGVPLGLGGLFGGRTIPVTFEGEELLPNQTSHEVEFSRVGPGYFATMGMPIEAGRAFDRSDREGEPAVAIINRTMAERHWPDEDPVGARFYRDGEPVRVVGIARDSKYRHLNEEAMPFVYLPFLQQPGARASLLVRASGDLTALSATLRKEVNAAVPDLPVLEARPLTESIAISLLPQRMAAAVAGVLGLIGLLLAAVGISGIVSYSVSQRTHEMGVRLSLGAQRGDLVRMVTGDSMRLVAVGLVVGVAGALFLARFMESFLIGISRHDPVTYVLVAGLLTAIAFLASYLPARRVAKVDPIGAVMVDCRAAGPGPRAAAGLSPRARSRRCRRRSSSAVRPLSSPAGPGCRRWSEPPAPAPG